MSSVPFLIAHFSSSFWCNHDEILLKQELRDADELMADSITSLSTDQTIPVSTLGKLFNLHFLV